MLLGSVLLNFPHLSMWIVILCSLPHCGSQNDILYSMSVQSSYLQGKKKKPCEPLLSLQIPGHSLRIMLFEQAVITFWCSLNVATTPHNQIKPLLVNKLKQQGLHHPTSNVSDLVKWPNPFLADSLMVCTAWPNKIKAHYAGPAFFPPSSPTLTMLKPINTTPTTHPLPKRCLIQRTDIR